MTVPGKPTDYCLELKRNLYGQKQAGRVWHNYLLAKLKGIGFKQSRIDPCVLYRGECIYVLYTDDTLLFGTSKDVTDAVVRDLKAAGLKLTEEGSITDFLGVNVETRDGKIHLNQPLLTSTILSELRISQAPEETSNIPMSEILDNGKTDVEFDKHFDYRSIIGMLLYLEKGTRPDLAYCVHQCARYSSNPKKKHAKALKKIGKYLKSTRSKGTIMTPDATKHIEIYVDADFAGNWTKLSSNNPRSSLSRS